MVLRDVLVVQVQVQVLCDQMLHNHSESKIQVNKLDLDVKSTKILSVFKKHKQQQVYNVIGIKFVHTIKFHKDYRSSAL